MFLIRLIVNQNLFSFFVTDFIWQWNLLKMVWTVKKPQCYRRSTDHIYKHFYLLTTNELLSLDVRDHSVLSLQIYVTLLLWIMLNIQNYVSIYITNMSFLWKFGIYITLEIFLNIEIVKYIRTLLPWQLVWTKSQSYYKFALFTVAVIMDFFLCFCCTSHFFW